MTKPTKAIYNKRLLKLADLLDADAKRKKGISFNFNRWGDLCVPKDANPKTFLESDAVMSCNTQACAMGLAAVSRAFKDDGLTPSFNWSGGNDYRIGFKWKGRNTDGITAATKLFGLEQTIANYLFANAFVPEGGYGGKAERAVAKNIRYYVKTGGCCY